MVTVAETFENLEKNPVATSVRSPGWVEALQLMKAGSKWRLFIPSALAYGPNGAPGSPIGPDSTLIFDVELLKVIGK